jgi:hypothetical protein
MKKVGLVFLFVVVALAVCVGVVILPALDDDNGGGGSGNGGQSGGGGGQSVKRTADLEAVIAAVERWNSGAAAKEAVAQGAHKKLYEGDGATVDGLGYAKLNMGGCLLAIFRDSNLDVEGIPSQSAPACVVKFQQGTIYGQVSTETIVQTDWAVIRTLGTDFLVHLDLDRELLWVIVRTGLVEIDAAGQQVQVGAGHQTWVHRNQPPEPPRPATRWEVGDLFPLLDDLTNGQLSDSRLLKPGGEPPVEELVLTLERSTDEVFAGECGEPQTVQVYAMLSGSEKAIADVEGATLRYQWDGIEEQWLSMERLDDRTFMVEIDPSEYCCMQTPLVYTVEVFNSAEDIVASGVGELLLSFCLG